MVLNQKLLDLRTKAQQAHEEAKDRRLTEVQSLFKCKVKNKKPKVSRSESKFTKEFPEALCMRLVVRKDNENAQKFYLNYGFDESDALPKYYADCDGLEMLK